MVFSKIQVYRLIKNNIYFVLLLLIGVFFLIPLFNQAFYDSHDGSAHLARFGAYIKAFSDGQFPFRFAGDLNYGYGSPVLNFYYPLPGIIAIPSYFIGISLENIFKLSIGFSFILSFVSFYLWINELVKDKNLAFIGALLYGLTPYHFLNLYVRAGIAEVMAFGFVPLVFLFIEKTIQNKNIKFPILGGIFYALLILSHNSVSLIFSPIFLLYSIIRAKDLRGFISLMFILVLGLSLSAFFWLPAILDAKYTNSKLFIGDMFKFHFPSIQKLIFSPWGFGPNVNEPGGLSPQIGPINLFLVLVASVVLFFKKLLRREIFFWFFIFAVSVFLTISYSTYLWYSLPFLSNLQFPWRIVGVSSFASVVLGVLALKNFDKRIGYLIVFLLVLYSLQFLKINYIKSKPDSFYFNYPGTTYYHGEASPIWTAGDFGSYPKKSFEIISGNGTYTMNLRKSNLHKYTMDAKSDLQVLDNTIYFPGWKAYIDDDNASIQFQDPNHRGLITFNVPKGKHVVTLELKETGLRLLGDLISVLSFVLVFFVFLFEKRLAILIRRK